MELIVIFFLLVLFYVPVHVAFVVCRADFTASILGPGAPLLLIFLYAYYLFLRLASMQW